MNRTGRILVVGPAWVGDMVMSHSLYRVLGERLPGARIDVLAPGWTRPLLERMPQVSEAVDMPLGHGELGLRVRYRIGRVLRARRYDRAIVLPSSLKSALVPCWAGIARRTGYRGEMRRGLLNDIRRLDAARTTVERFVALGLEPDDSLPDPVPAPALRVSVARAEAVLRRLGLPCGAGPILAVCPGGEFGPAKRWPEAHFARVARHQRSRGWQVWIFGSDRDRAAAAGIGRHLRGDCTDLTGRTSLAEAVDLMSLTTVVVTNDSGLMHVAAALDRRVVAIYGATDPTRNPPLHPAARVLRLALDCSPCRQRVCPLGHYRCLRELAPEQVIEAIEAF